MHGRLAKICRGAVAMPLLVGSIGLFGGLGLALAAGGAASAAGPTVRGDILLCHASRDEEGPRHHPGCQHCRRPRCHRETIYVAQPQAVLTIPASLIKLAKDADIDLSDK